MMEFNYFFGLYDINNEFDCITYIYLMSNFYKPSYSRGQKRSAMYSR